MAIDYYYANLPMAAADLVSILGIAIGAFFLYRYYSRFAGEDIEYSKRTFGLFVLFVALHEGSEAVHYFAHSDPESALVQAAAYANILVAFAFVFYASKLRHACASAGVKNLVAMSIRAWGSDASKAVAKAIAEAAAERPDLAGARVEQKKLVLPASASASSVIALTKRIRFKLDKDVAPNLVDDFISNLWFGK